MSGFVLPAAAPLHAGAWLCWLGAVLALMTITRNPLYLGLALAWIGAVGVAVGRAPATRPGLPWSPLTFGVVVVPLSALFNGLTVHVGATVLARLPAGWPLLGGPLTLEAMVYGALNGVALTGLFAAFAVANRSVSLRQVIQLIPRAYYPVALVVAIAVSFVPATLRQWQQVREAQAVRGHRMRGWRSWLPLWAPLLTGGLERALQLAEAMTARGFAGGPPLHNAWTRAGVLVGLPLAGAGLLLRTVWGQALAGALLLVAGAGLVAVAVWLAGRRRPHTRYRPTPWRMAEWVAAAGALITAGAFLLPLPGMERSSIFWSPYPALSLPGFALGLGVATWGLLAPAAALMVRNHDRI
ncbi:MAG TPA: energy-coupling factor transporter transmembrane component T [Caldilineaceae bacterium]|nr:energy-coupling factor transporter transmembrane component T [Caldilineaceae bacterium]